jgi:hypothetical protein
VFVAHLAEGVLPIVTETPLVVGQVIGAPGGQTGARW